jgi:uncharacterized membrane protein
MRLLAAIEPDQVKTYAIVGIAVLLVLAFLVMRFIQKMVLKLIIVGVLVAAGVFVYTQRSSLDDCQQKLRSPQLEKDPGERCVCGFAGFDITIPECNDLLKDAPTG